MCRRFTRFLTWREIHALYRLTTEWEKGRNDELRYNIAPTETVPFVVAGENGNHAVKEGRWWLVPWWAKEMQKPQRKAAQGDPGRAVACTELDIPPQTTWSAMVRWTMQGLR